MSKLITGAGLICSQTAALLAARVEPVVLLDLAPQSAHIASVLPLAKVTVEAGDVSDRDGLSALMAGHRITKVVRTAAALSMSIRREPALAADVKFLGTVNLLEAGQHRGVAPTSFAHNRCSTARASRPFSSSFPKKPWC